MSITVASGRFFVTGGALRDDAPSYVERPADQRLQELIEAGELCYVLTTRQMGKSSLMARTAAVLRDHGFHTVLIDLTAIGSAPIHEWYLSFLDEIQSQLALATDAEAWWYENSSLSPVRRFTKFFEEVLPHEVGGQVAIFIDEIDAVLNLAFAGDFFAAIRSLYNRPRLFAEDQRVSFVLLGVAAPDDLIKDRSRTPFNVGTRLDLNEFALEDAGVLLLGLPRQDHAILERIFYWTNGHPYLTQRMGAAIAGNREEQWDAPAVDTLARSLFLTDQAISQESNLQFVSSRVTSSPNISRLLKLYRDIYQGKRVKSIEQSTFQNELKLYGLVRTGEDGYLVVRNRIYEQVFDEEWIKENSPQEPWRRVAMVAVVVLVIALAAFGYYWQQRPGRDQILAQEYISGFAETTNPTLRLDNLANLLELDGYTEDALRLFNTLTLDEQITLFENATPDILPQIKGVVLGVYTTLYVEDFAEAEATTRLLKAMADALGRAPDAESQALSNEIRIWSLGRDYAVAEQFQPSRTTYDVAIEFNVENPATHLERAYVMALSGEYEAALADLAVAWEYGPPWDQSVLDRVNGDGRLLSAAYALQNPPPFMELLPSPTPTAAPTPKPTITPLPTATSTTVPTRTPTAEPTATATASPTRTPTNTPRPTLPPASATPAPTQPPTLPVIATPVPDTPRPPATSTLAPAPTDTASAPTETPGSRPPTPTPP